LPDGTADDTSGGAYVGVHDAPEHRSAEVVGEKLTVSAPPRVKIPSPSHS
jgi:hypothetical protein